MDNHVTRHVEDLDAIREFLPLGFLTGALGINVGGISGVENGNVFWIFCGVLIAISNCINHYI